MDIFQGLFGYERVMLAGGMVLFVFTLAVTTVLLLQRRSTKLVLGLSAVFLPIAIAMIGFPGIQSIQFGKDVTITNRARDTPPDANLSTAQKKDLTSAIANVQRRSTGNPVMQAKVADAYRAIGDVDRAYNVAESVLAKHPPAAARQLLVPVLTAKLVQQTAGLEAPHAPTAAAAKASQQREIANLASQLHAQAAATPLPANSHLALAHAYVAIGKPEQAQASIQAAQHVDPLVPIPPALLHALQNHRVASPPSSGGH